MSESVIAGMCTGKSCRKRDEHAALRAQLTEIDGDVAELSCLGVCKGPVVVLRPGRDDDAVVLQRVRSAKARRDVRRIIGGSDHLSNRLRKRLVFGTKRAKALKRFERAVARRRRSLGDITDRR